MNLQGIDHVCINPFDNITDIDNNFKYKKIENPFLINWKSKYIQRTTNSKNEGICTTKYKKKLYKRLFWLNIP